MKVFILFMSICHVDAGCITTPLETFTSEKACYEQVSKANQFAYSIIKNDEDSFSVVDCLTHKEGINV